MSLTSSLLNVSTPLTMSSSLGVSGHSTLGSVTIQGNAALFSSAGNQLIYADASNIMKSSTNLTFNGATLGVGTSTPDQTSKLHVAGAVKVDGELKVASVKTATWTVAPDYVFEKEYKLASLEEVDAFVKKNKHFLEVPSAKHFKEKGMDLAEMNFTLLKKV